MNKDIGVPQKRSQCLQQNQTNLHITLNLEMLIQLLVLNENF